MQPAGSHRTRVAQDPDRPRLALPRLVREEPTGKHNSHERNANARGAQPALHGALEARTQPACHGATEHVPRASSALLTRTRLVVWQSTSCLAAAVQASGFGLDADHELVHELGVDSEIASGRKAVQLLSVDLCQANATCVLLTRASHGAPLCDRVLPSQPERALGRSAAGRSMYSLVSS